MGDADRSASTVSISNSLKVSITKEVYEQVYIGEKAQDVAEISIELSYVCDKLLGKCFDDFKVALEVHCSEEVPIDTDIKELYFKGKISGKTEDRDVNVSIERGRGEGSMIITYVIRARPVKIGRYSLSIGIYYTRREVARERIGDVIDIVFDVVEPVTVERLLIEPEADTYTVGDRLKLALEVSSRYEGTVSLVCRGAVGDVTRGFNIGRGPARLELESVISNPSDRVEVSIHIPDIGYKEVLYRELVVKRERFRVNEIRPGDSKIGSEFVLCIGLENLSKLGETPLLIDGRVYGFPISEKIVLKPMERMLVELKIPTLTSDSIHNLECELTIRDTVSNYLLTQSVTLPKPKELPVGIEPSSDSIQIYSDKIHELQLFVTNDGDKDVVVFPIKISSNLCVLDKVQRVEVHSYTLSQLSIALKPLSLGDEIATIDIALEVNGSIVDVRQVRVGLKIIRSFNIKDKRLLNPSRTAYAVKGQEVEIELVVEVLSDYVDLTIESNDIQVSQKSHRLYNPGGSLSISGRVGDYGDGISLSVSDGLVKEVIEIPLKVEKPSIEYKLITSRYFTGLKRPVKIEFTNRFEVPLAVSIEFTGLSGVELPNESRRRELHIEPLGSQELSIELVCVSSGRARATFKIYSYYTDEEGKNVIDTWSREDSFEIDVENPVGVGIKQYSDKVLLPYPVAGGARGVDVGYVLDVRIRNVSDSDLYDVEIGVDTHSSGAIKFEIDHPKISLVRIGEEARASVVTKIPIDISLNELDLSISVSIRGYGVASKPIKVGIERYLYSVLKIPRLQFKEMCSYPAYQKGDIVLVMFPLLERDVDVCGEPTKMSIVAHEVLQSIYEDLAGNLPPYGSPWEAAASIIFKKAIGIPTSYDEYRSYLREMTPSRKDIFIVPGYLWSVTMLRLLGVSQGTLVGLSKSVSLGLIYAEGSVLYRSTNTFYVHLLQFIERGDRDAGERLYNYVLNSIRRERIDPLFLLYILNGGRKLPYDSNMADKLLNEKKYDEYIMYLVLTDKNIIEDPKILSDLSEIKSVASKVPRKRSNVTALALLFDKMVKENVNSLSEG